MGYSIPYVIEKTSSGERSYEGRREKKMLIINQKDIK